jgi:hypothetical protein
MLSSIHSSRSSDNPGDNLSLFHPVTVTYIGERFGIQSAQCENHRTKKSLFSLLADRSGRPFSETSRLTVGPKFCSDFRRVSEVRKNFTASAELRIKVKNTGWLDSSWGARRLQESTELR